MVNDPRYLRALAATAVSALFAACAMSPKAEHTAQAEPTPWRRQFVHGLGKRRAIGQHRRDVFEHDARLGEIIDITD